MRYATSCLTIQDDREMEDIFGIDDKGKMDKGKRILGFPGA